MEPALPSPAPSRTALLLAGEAAAVASALRAQAAAKWQAGRYSSVSVGGGREFLLAPRPMRRCAEPLFCVPPGPSLPPLAPLGVACHGFAP